MNYKKHLEQLIWRKYQDAEQVGNWFAKLTSVRRRKLHKLFSQDSRCVFCRCETWLPTPGLHKQRHPIMPQAQMATLEHKLQQSMGGDDNPSNLTLACRRCNNQRGDIPFINFLNGERLVVDHTAKQAKANARRERKISQLTLLFISYNANILQSCLRITNEQR